MAINLEMLNVSYILNLLLTRNFLFLLWLLTFHFVNNIELVPNDNAKITGKELIIQLKENYGDSSKMSEKVQILLVSW